MKIKILYSIFFCLSTILLLTGCSKKGNTPNPPSVEVPRILTDHVDSVTQTSVVVYGEIKSTGGGTVTDAGFCWSSTNLYPTISDSKTSASVQAGLFKTKISGLTEGTTYYVRAYAKNGAGVGYGNAITFVASSPIPTVRTIDISSVSSDYAFIDGKIVSHGSAAVSAYGVCWSTTPNPTINDNKTIDGSGDATFFSQLNNLTVNTTYYVRAYATNSYGTGYGDELSFTTAYYIGEVFGGGKIVYIDGTKEHGLIAATADQSIGASWSNGSFVWTYAWDFDDGISNTTNIINAQGNGTYAATVCQNYTGGGYTDWFLPALYQLHHLFDAKNEIGNVTPYYYWSSTEDYDYVASAWVVRMDSQIGEESPWTKNNLFVVRAFRAF